MTANNPAVGDRVQFRPTALGHVAPCPNCGSDSIARIQWGMPSMGGDLRDELAAGEVIIGGCLGPFTNDRHCNACGLSFDAPWEAVGSASPWRGFSPLLKWQMDLLDKLRADLARLERDPGDDYAAWDFFATAEAMRDWNQSRGLPPVAIGDDPLLGLVSDIACHGKHYLTRDPKLVNVQGIEETGAFDHGAFDPAVFDTARLVIMPTDDGEAEGAVDLARRVIEWWEAELSR